MTLFGQTLDGQQIFGLVSLVVLLAFWLVILRKERRYARWFRQWEADIHARRVAQVAPRHQDGEHKRGPWG